MSKINANIYIHYVIGWYLLDFICLWFCFQFCYCISCSISQWKIKTMTTVRQSNLSHKDKKKGFYLLMQAIDMTKLIELDLIIIQKDLTRTIKLSNLCLKWVRSLHLISGINLNPGLNLKVQWITAVMLPRKIF